MPSSAPNPTRLASCTPEPGGHQEDEIAHGHGQALERDRGAEGTGCPSQRSASHVSSEPDTMPVTCHAMVVSSRGRSLQSSPYGGVEVRGLPGEEAQRLLAEQPYRERAPVARTPSRSAAAPRAARRVAGSLRGR